MERMWWLPKYTYPLHTDVCNWERPAGPENRRPTKEGSVPSGLQNGEQTKPRTLKVLGRLSGSVNVTLAYLERQKAATGPVPI